MHRKLVVLHRWLGLFMAAFLFMAGLTGAIIAWEHELDSMLNPDLYYAHSGGRDASGRTLSALALADQVEAADPHAQVSYLPLAAEPGHTLNLFVQPRNDPATGKPYELSYNQVALDPGTGERQGAREWGAPSLSRIHLLPFLYRLHYSLHLPQVGGIESGALVMGLVAIVWMLDCFIALWIAFPNRKTWRKSFAFRLRQGKHKLTFDLHRSGGVWAWLLLLPLAVTAISMNLERDVVRPLVASVSTLQPDPYFDRLEAGYVPGDAPVLPRARIVEAAREEAARRGISDPPGALFYSEPSGLYGVGFFQPGQDHADGKLGNPWLAFDARSGELAGAEIPGTGSAGDLFLQAQFPLHSGRILGVWGRALVCLLGLAVAMLSATGVILWARKRRARVRAAQAKGAAKAAEAVNDGTRVDDKGMEPTPAE